MAAGYSAVTFWGGNLNSREVAPGCGVGGGATGRASSVPSDRARLKMNSRSQVTHHTRGRAATRAEGKLSALKSPSAPAKKRLERGCEMNLLNIIQSHERKLE